jgi:hypothetical protein
VIVWVNTGFHNLTRQMPMAGRNHTKREIEVGGPIEDGFAPGKPLWKIA